MRALLQLVANGSVLTESQAEAAFATIMDGQATQAQMASFLTALHLRGETRAELTGAVRAMRARMSAIAAPPGTIDVCGTGGDGFGTLNVSTATAFVVAACGVKIAKHGNRAMSSRSGGIDVLGALGFDVDAPAHVLERQLAEHGLTFLNAQRHHPAVRFAAPVRAELGFRTIFNLMGPLANPARVTRQLIGVYDPVWAPIMAATLGQLGSAHVWIVHSQGLDEFTLAGETLVTEWRHNELRNFTITPDQAGLSAAPLEAIRGGDAAENASALLALLKGAPGAYRDTVLLNAAAALIIADKVPDMQSGVQRAAHALDSGAAHTLLQKLLGNTQYNPD